jgi:hypothetical protein
MAAGSGHHFLGSKPHAYPIKKYKQIRRKYHKGIGADNVKF